MAQPSLKKGTGPSWSSTQLEEGIKYPPPLSLMLLISKVFMSKRSPGPPGLASTAASGENPVRQLSLGSREQC